MLLWVILIIVILWAAGFGFGVAGSLIHLLIILAIVLVVVELVSRSRAL